MTKHGLYGTQDGEPETRSMTVLLRRLRAAIALLIALFPASVLAQYVRIKLNIRAKVGVMDILSSPLTMKSGQNALMLTGNYLLYITSDENVQVLATLTASDSLRNGRGNALPLAVELAYSTDRPGVAPTTVIGNKVSFLLSSSGDNTHSRKELAKILNASFFVRGDTGLLQEARATIHGGNAPPQDKSSLYVGDIYLNIEYN